MGNVRPQLSDSIRTRVADRIGASRFRTWFGDATEFQIDDTHLDVMVDNAFVGSWIANNYMKDLVGAAQDVLGVKDTVEVRIVEKKASESPSIEDEPDPEPPAPLPTMPNRRNRRRPDPVLRGTLDAFIVGPSNQLAYSAALQMVRNPGQAFKLMGRARRLRTGQDPPAARDLQRGAAGAPDAGLAIHFRRRVHERVHLRGADAADRRVSVTLPQRRPAGHRRHSLPGQQARHDRTSSCTRLMRSMRAARPSCFRPIATRVRSRRSRTR